MNKNDSLLYILNYYSLSGQSSSAWGRSEVIVVFDKEGFEKLLLFQKSPNIPAYVYLVKVLQSRNVKSLSPSWVTK